MNNAPEDQEDREVIEVVVPSPGTLIGAVYDPADYRDAFLVSPEPGTFANVGEFASAYFLNQPRWLSLVSMNLLSHAKLVDAIGDATYEEGSSVGSWTVHARGDDEIVFGDDMGFMEYRFSFWMRPDRRVEASTAVRYKWRRAGRFYFAIVKPMHRRFVPLSLRSVLVARAPMAAA